MFYLLPTCLPATSSRESMPPGVQRSKHLGPGGAEASSHGWSEAEPVVPVGAHPNTEALVARSLVSRRGKVGRLCYARAVPEWRRSNVLLAGLREPGDCGGSAQVAQRDAEEAIGTALVVLDALNFLCIELGDGSSVERAANVEKG